MEQKRPHKTQSDAVFISMKPACRVNSGHLSEVGNVMASSRLLEGASPLGSSQH